MAPGGLLRRKARSRPTNSCRVPAGPFQPMMPLGLDATFGTLKPKPETVPSSPIHKPQQSTKFPEPNYFRPTSMSGPNSLGRHTSRRGDRFFSCRHRGSGGRGMVRANRSWMARPRPNADRTSPPGGPTLTRKWSLWGGSAFRYHSLRLHHNPTRRRCYPYSTHAGGAKTRLLLPGVELRRLGHDVNDRRLWT